MACGWWKFGRETWMASPPLMLLNHPIFHGKFFFFSYIRTCSHLSFYHLNQIHTHIKDLSSNWCLRQTDYFLALSFSFSFLKKKKLRSLLIISFSYKNRFIWASIITGISFCVMTSIGHIAADTANGHCLSCVSFFSIIFGHFTWISRKRR